MSPRGGVLRLWADDQKPDFISLIATADRASEALVAGTEAMHASADQLRSEAVAGRRRLESEPCPDPELEARLTTLIDRYDLMARSFDESPEGNGDGYIAALAQQLRVLITDITVFVADLGHAIEGH